MKIQTTDLPGVVLISPAVHEDARGFFYESYHEQRYQEAGIHARFVQDNQSRSVRNTLRGLHFQRRQPQGKLVSVIQGRVLDIVVDINPKSHTFGKHVSVELDDQNHQQLWVPPGYAHGYLVLSNEANYHYKCTHHYNPDDEAGLAWDCPTLAIHWPTSTPLLSQKDQHHPNLTQHQQLGTLETCVF